MEKPRVLLIYPPTPGPRESARVCMLPLGTAWLAATLRRENEVHVIDATAEGYSRVRDAGGGFVEYGLSVEEIRSRIAQIRPHVVGVTCLFSSHWPAVKAIARAAKSVDPNIITVTGGTHPTFLAAECLAEEPAIDAVVPGEGEITVEALCHSVRDGKPLDAVAGIACRRDGKPFVDARAPFIENLDTLPFPAWDLFPMETYFRVNIPHDIVSREARVAPVATSRGCSAGCVFCSSTVFWGRRYRTRSPENVLDEIQTLHEKYGVREIEFEDDNLTLRREHCTPIFEGLIARRLPVCWSMPNGLAVWTVDDSLLELMKRSGCYQITLAIESGDPVVLRDVVKKPLDLDRVMPIARKARSLGININSFFIIGFPGETRQQAMHTIAFARRLQPDKATFMIATPLPGTRLHETAVAQGLLDPGFRFDRAAFTRVSLRHAEIPPEELERIIRRETFRFNMTLILTRPRSFLRRYGPFIRRRPLFFLSLFFSYFRAFIVGHKE